MLWQDSRPCAKNRGAPRVQKGEGTVHVRWRALVFGSSLRTVSSQYHRREQAPPGGHNDDRRPSAVSTRQFLLARILGFLARESRIKRKRLGTQKRNRGACTQLDARKP